MAAKHDGPDVGVREPHGHVAVPEHPVTRIDICQATIAKDNKPDKN